MDMDLVVSSHQVDFGEDGTTEKLVGVIVDMPNVVAVGNGTGVEGFVIATGTPHYVLGYDMWRRGPGTNGAASCSIAQHGVELGFGDTRCSPAGRVGSEISARMLSIVVPPVTVLPLGNRLLAAWAGTDNDVTPFSSRLFRQCTKKPKWERKFTPMIGCVTPAKTNRHVKFRRRTKLRLRASHPYVRIVVSLTAQRA
jgi:hypothetical protein